MSDQNNENNDSKISTDSEITGGTDNLQRKGKEVDLAFEDPPIVKPFKQLWCCISFVSPETLTNCNFRAIKVRGVYATKEEAEKRAQFLQDIDPQFNIFVGEVGKWLGWDPDPNSIEDQHYKEKKLQELMKKYKKNRDKAKVMEEERKREMLEESIRSEANKPKTRREKLRDKLEKRKLDNKLKDIEEDRYKLKDSDIISKKEEFGKKERLRLNNNEALIESSKENIGSIDDNINKLQEMYKKMLVEKNKNKK